MTKVRFINRPFIEIVLRFAGGWLYNYFRFSYACRKMFTFSVLLCFAKNVYSSMKKRQKAPLKYRATTKSPYIIVKRSVECSTWGFLFFNCKYSSLIQYSFSYFLKTVFCSKMVIKMVNSSQNGLLRLTVISWVK